MDADNQARQDLLSDGFWRGAAPVRGDGIKRTADIGLEEKEKESRLSEDAVTTLRQDADQSLRISVFHSFDQARSLWQKFEKHAECYAFQRYDWLRNWHAFVGAGQNLTVCITLIERSDGAPLMLLPLAIEPRGSMRCLIWLGGIVSDYQAPLIARDASEHLQAGRFAALWKEVRARLPRHDAVILEKQPEYIGAQQNPFFYLPHSPNVSNAHFTYLGGDFETFLAAKRSSHWWSLERKKERRMAKHGALNYRLARDPQDAQHILHETMRQKSQSYQVLGVWDMFADPAHRRFFSHMSMHHVEDGFVHLSALTLDDRILATHWGLVHQDRFYCYLPTYARDDYARFSPGNSLLRRLMEWSIGRGLRAFDFTIGDETYKYGWCDQELRIFDCLHATTFKGWLYLTPLKLGRWAKRRILRSSLARPARQLRAQIGRWKIKYC